MKKARFEGKIDFRERVGGGECSILYCGVWTKASTFRGDRSYSDVWGRGVGRYTFCDQNQNLILCFEISKEMLDILTK